MMFFAKNFDELSATQVYEMLKSRAEVFMLGQNIRCLDMDDVDYEARHYFIEEGKRIIAYLRAYYKDDSRKTVKIGRVLTQDHGKGTGRLLMDYALTDIRTSLPCRDLYIEAQLQAKGFYEKMGFIVASDVFPEQGIPHIIMERDL